jgi:hypothetical protein
MNLCETTKCVKKIQKITLDFSRQVVFLDLARAKIARGCTCAKMRRRQRGFFLKFSKRMKEKIKLTYLELCVCESQ